MTRHHPLHRHPLLRVVGIIPLLEQDADLRYVVPPVILEGSSSHRKRNPESRGHVEYNTREEIKYRWVKSSGPSSRQKQGGKAPPLSNATPCIRYSLLRPGRAAEVLGQLDLEFIAQAVVEHDFVRAHGFVVERHTEPSRRGERGITRRGGLARNWGKACARGGGGGEMLHSLLHHILESKVDDQRGIHVGRSYCSPTYSHLPRKAESSARQPPPGSLRGRTMPRFAWQQKRFLV